jgi:hypothetical protein
LWEQLACGAVKLSKRITAMSEINDVTRCLDADGGGEFKLICVSGSMDCGFSRNSVDFTWQGYDEMDEASGSGEAEIGDGGILTRSHTTTATKPFSRRSVGDFFNSQPARVADDTATQELLAATARAARPVVSDRAGLDDRTLLERRALSGNRGFPSPHALRAGRG